MIDCVTYIQTNRRLWNFFPDNRRLRDKTNERYCIDYDWSFLYDFRDSEKWQQEASADTVQRKKMEDLRRNAIDEFRRKDKNKRFGWKRKISNKLEEEKIKREAEEIERQVMLDALRKLHQQVKEIQLAERTLLKEGKLKLRTPIEYQTYYFEDVSQALDLIYKLFKGETLFWTLTYERLYYGDPQIVIARIIIEGLSYVLVRHM